MGVSVYYVSRGTRAVVVFARSDGYVELPVGGAFGSVAWRHIEQREGEAVGSGGGVDACIDIVGTCRRGAAVGCEDGEDVDVGARRYELVFCVGRDNGVVAHPSHKAVACGW